MRLLDSLRTNSRHTELQVLEAAEHVVAAWTADASRLQDLSDYLRRAKEWLGELLEDPRLRATRTEKLAELVSSTLLLIPPADDQSRVELSSRLRKLKNSALAIHVVKPVVTRDPGNTFAATTYAAALIDSDEALQAAELLKQLLKTSPKDGAILITLSRAQSALGHFRDAHTSALNAFRLQQNDYSAHRLLASSAQIEDSAAFEEALQFVEDLIADNQSTLSANVLLLAAEELVRSGSTAGAKRAVRKLLEMRWKGDSAKRVIQLKRWLEQNDQLSLGLSDA